MKLNIGLSHFIYWSCTMISFVFLFLCYVIRKDNFIMFSVDNKLYAKRICLCQSTLKRFGDILFVPLKPHCNYTWKFDYKVLIPDLSIIEKLCYLLWKIFSRLFVYEHDACFLYVSIFVKKKWKHISKVTLYIETRYIFYGYSSGLKLVILFRKWEKTWEILFEYIFCIKGYLLCYFEKK